MERTTLYLTSEMKRLLAEESMLTGATEASIIREALGGYLVRRRRPRVRAVGRSKDGGVARHVDEALEKLGFGK